MVTLGKCRNRERLTSLNSTFALRLLLICFFISVVIWFLKTNGAAKAQAKQSEQTYASDLKGFFTIGARIIG